MMNQLFGNTLFMFERLFGLKLYNLSSQNLPVSRPSKAAPAFRHGRLEVALVYFEVASLALSESVIDVVDLVFSFYHLLKLRKSVGVAQCILVLLLHQLIQLLLLGPFSFVVAVIDCLLHSIDQILAALHALCQLVHV